MTRILAFGLMAAILAFTAYVVISTAIALHELDVVLSEVQSHHNR